MAIRFAARSSVEQVEEGNVLAPKFNEDGLIPVVTTEVGSGLVLMQGFMNEEALRLTIEKAEMHYFSRSRQCLWRKGETSGLIQQVVRLLVDDDQDCLWAEVEVGGSGASCHVGFKSCFYREIPLPQSGEKEVTLRFTESEKRFDPETVYGNLPNPTKL